ncbi:MAG: NDP-sugar synthase [Terracidiphilus sp.]
MKAMILAAGLGTRLRPLTDDRPKALVTVAGRTLLQIAIDRLSVFGVREVIVNAHHHADMIVDYLRANHNFGMRIEISREPVLLDTGGGLKRAAWFFLEGGEDAQLPFIVHNVDVISSIDLERMVRYHTERDALATLAVQERESSRQLLFDEHGQLCGRHAVREANDNESRSQLSPAVHGKALAFSGVHVVSPRLLEKLEMEGAFSIVDAYLHLAAMGEKIIAYRADECYWRDLGRPESLIHAARDMESRKYV